jgi:hypothetical protein
VSHVISEKIGNRCSGAIGEEGATVGSKGVKVLMEGVYDDKEKEGGDRGALGEALRNRETLEYSSVDKNAGCCATEEDLGPTDHPA